MARFEPGDYIKVEFKDELEHPRSDKSGKLVRYSGTLLSLLVVAFIAVFVVASFNPGCLSADTLDQWGQSGLKIYHDWHPATLTILMTYVRRIYDGLQAMVVLQVLLFTTGVLLILRRHAGPLFRSILLLGLTCVPRYSFIWASSAKTRSWRACSSLR